MKYKLESRLQGEISTTSDMQTTYHYNAESEEELKRLRKKGKDISSGLLVATHWTIKS